MKGRAKDDMTKETNGAQTYARLHREGLTLAQQSAVDLLADGSVDARHTPDSQATGGENAPANRVGLG
jgi:hypothetical protein